MQALKFVNSNYLFAYNTSDYSNRFEIMFPDFETAKSYHHELAFIRLKNSADSVFLTHNGEKLTMPKKQK